MDIDGANNGSFVDFVGGVQLLPDGDCAWLPERGIVCRVLSTRLGSSQGRLIRTILFSSERFSVESKDAYFLLMFLTVFAVIASAYVCYNGSKAGTIARSASSSRRS